MPGSVPLDLVDACLQRLRGSECAALFGDTWDPATATGAEKFGADYIPRADPPWAVLTEPNETYTFMSPGPGNLRPYLADGQLQVSVYAAERRQARTLADAVGRALNDADLAYIDRHHGSLRMASAGFVPTTETGPGTAALFHRVVIFTYENQGQL